MRVLSACSALLLFLVTAGSVVGEAAAGDKVPGSGIKKIVLIAGPMDQGPGGHPPGTHEYEKSVLLIKHALETAPNLHDVYCEVHFGGWPDDPSTLDDADTIVLLSDGADRDEQDHPLLVDDRLAQLQRQIDRGCGFVAIHWTLFVPSQTVGEKFLHWIGGYFDYQGGPGGGWYSKIQTATTEPEFVSPEHPVSRGLDRFELREEYYYNIRMRPGMPGLSPILATSLPNEPQRQVVAWALERPDGGRGFGFTGGHFFDNWQREPFRRMVLNAVVWSAGADVPEGGVESTLPSDEALQVGPADAPIRTLIVTGHQHPAHDWRETTKALQETLGRDARFDVAVVVDPEHLGEAALDEYDLLVMNYCNWERDGLSEASREGLIRFVSSGKGLALIHFANGAFLDWPEWRQLCRRVWIDGVSGHDNYGEFVVEVANDQHPITAGMSSFETVDELYFRQQGDAPIEVLATARSSVTGQDEPMAFVYRYGKGRVFQTVLGHAAESLRTPGTSTLVRRGSVWAAGRPQLASEGTLEPVQPTAEDALVEGRFGRALDARLGGATAKSNAAYRTLPLTVECWAQLNSKANFNILVASAAKDSPEHWEIYSYAQTGEFSAYLPGYQAEIKSGIDITDGEWHHLAMTFDGARVRLYVDGRSVKEVGVERVAPGTMAGPLWFGCYPPGSIGCDGRVDEVRISNIIRSIDGVPGGPPTIDEHTVGLWRFDDVVDETYADASSLGNFAKPRFVRVGLPDVSTYRLDDPGLKVVAVDRSATDSFLSIRADSTGRLFVGGRESLFVYEPRSRGRYAPRRELYRFPPHSWIADVAIRGDDLYVMTSSALYLLPGARTKREGIEARRLIWGLPLDLHVSYHAMAWGPEGDLYFNSGDPLLNYGDASRPDHWGHWTIHCQPEGTRVPYTGVGGSFVAGPTAATSRWSRRERGAASAWCSTASGICSPMTTTTSRSPRCIRRHDCCT